MSLPDMLTSVAAFSVVVHCVRIADRVSATTCDGIRWANVLLSIGALGVALSPLVPGWSEWVDAMFVAGVALWMVFDRRAGARTT